MAFDNFDIIFWMLNSVPRRYVLGVGAFSADLSHGHAFDDAWSFRNCSFKASRGKNRKKENIREILQASDLIIVKKLKLV